MEDVESIGLYWRRDERAIRETDRKYGSFCHGLALVIGTLAFDWEPNDTETQAPMDAPYMSYAGPLFPMTMREPVEGLTAERAIAYDFSQGNVLVRDAYVLQNTTEQPLELTLFAPIAGKFTTENWPSITVDGAEQPWELLAGDNPGRSRGRSDPNSI